MVVMIGGLVVFGCLVYITITLLSFTGHSASLETQLDDINTTLTHKKGRLEDYRVRAETLQTTVPDLRNKVTKLQNLVAALDRQRIRLQSRAKNTGNQSTQERDAAIQRSLAAAQRQKRKG